MTGTVHNIDCFVGLEKIPDQSVDLILTDPPYGATDCEWDKAPDLKRLFGEFNRIIKPKGAMVIMATQPFATDVINANRRRFRYDLVWVKNISVGFLNAKKMPLRKHEHLLVFYGKLPAYNPQMQKGKLHKRKSRKIYKSPIYKGIKKTYEYESDLRYPTSVLSFDRDQGSGFHHPTQKPLALFQWIVRTYSHPGQIVLDPFMGSGTTAVASKIEGRNFLGFETDQNFVKTAMERLEKVEITNIATEDGSPETKNVFTQGWFSFFEAYEGGRNG